MTRQEYEKQREEAIKNRKKSKFIASKGSFTIKPPDKPKESKAKKSNFID